MFAKEVAKPEARWLTGVGLVVGLFNAAALALGRAASVPVVDIYAGYVGNLLMFGTLAGLFWAAAFTLLLALRRVERPLGLIARVVVSRLGTRDRALGTIGPIILLPLMMGAFGTLKQILPMFTPYLWDSALARIGRALFFGVAPWQVTHAIFGPRATKLLDFIYAAWVPLLFVVALGVVMMGPPRLRARFIVAFIGAWLILGILGAFLFSSAGPCFATLIGAPDGPEFAPLVARLRAIDSAGYPLVSLAVQKELWSSYVAHRFGFGMGISAMPSMHNSMAFLYVLAAAGAPRWARIATWLFAITILIASVHLGFHYLADGLLAWLATAWIWQLSGRYLRWCGYEPTQPVAATAALPSNDVRRAKAQDLLAA